MIWFVTASGDARPQAVAVWFYWDGSSFLIYSQTGIKERHVRENPHVELHLNCDEVGDDVVRASGLATVSRSPKGRLEYTRKYRKAIRDLGMTTDEFFRRYSHPIVVRRLKFH